MQKRRVHRLHRACRRRPGQLPRGRRPCWARPSRCPSPTSRWIRSDSGLPGRASWTAEIGHQPDQPSSARFPRWTVTRRATKEKIVMIEAGAKEVPGGRSCSTPSWKRTRNSRRSVAFIQGIKARNRQAEVRVRVITMLTHEPVRASSKAAGKRQVSKVAMDTDDKTVRDAGVRADRQTSSRRRFADEYPGGARRQPCASALDKLQKKIVRRWIWRTASAWMAEAWRKSVRWRPR